MLLEGALPVLNTQHVKKGGKREAEGLEKQEEQRWVPRRPQSNKDHNTCMSMVTHAGPHLGHHCEHFLILLQFNHNRTNTHLTATLVPRNLQGICYLAQEPLHCEYQCCGDHAYVLHAHLNLTCKYGKGYNSGFLRYTEPTLCGNVVVEEGA